MKTKFVCIGVLTLMLGNNVQAQLLDALKQRAKEKGLETQEVSYDKAANEANKNSSNEHEELVINSAKDFFNKDVVMALYNNGKLVQTSYFDAATIAMRTEKDGTPYPIYHDDKGKFYAYYNNTGQYETMALLPSSSMGFMTAGMTTQVYKLPQQPYFEAYKALTDIDSGLNFLILELAFIYHPNHFKGNDYYIEKNVNCNSGKCIRFSYNDPEYPGSYIQFDDQDRLNELYINSTNPQFKDNPTGKFVFSYKECTVKLPDAVEQSIVPGPLGKILPIEKGLEPWKHNKTDKQKN